MDDEKLLIFFAISLVYGRRVSKNNMFSKVFYDSVDV